MQGVDTKGQFMQTKVSEMDDLGAMNQQELKDG